MKNNEKIIQRIIDSPCRLSLGSVDSRCRTTLNLIFLIQLLMKNWPNAAVTQGFLAFGYKTQGLKDKTQGFFTENSRTFS